LPGAGAGDGQAGFVSAADGVQGLAGDAVLAFDTVSGLARAALTNPGLAKPAPVSSRASAAAASADVLSGSLAPSPGLPDPSDVAVPGVTTAPGAPAPRGFGGTSGLPVLGPAPACDGTAAFGIVTSDRLLSGAFVKDAGLAVPDPDDEPGAAGEPDADDEPFLASARRPVAALSLVWNVAAWTVAAEPEVSTWPAAEPGAADG